MKSAKWNFSISTCTLTLFVTPPQSIISFTLFISCLSYSNKCFMMALHQSKHNWIFSEMKWNGIQIPEKFLRTMGLKGWKKSSLMCCYDQQQSLLTLRAIKVFALTWKGKYFFMMSSLPTVNFLLTQIYYKKYLIQHSTCYGYQSLLNNTSNNPHHMIFMCYFGIKNWWHLDE